MTSESAAALSPLAPAGSQASAALEGSPNSRSDHEAPALLLRIASDLDLEGYPHCEWLDVRSTGIATWSGEASADSIETHRFGWSTIEKVRTVTGTGSGTLQIRLSGEGWVDILRFSNALAARFHKVAQGLERLCESWQRGEGLSWPFGADELDPPRCATCGLRFGTKQESCPRCLQKGQILRRVVELVRPHLRGALFLSALTLVGVVAELIPPKLQQYLVDDILGAGVGNPANVRFSSALLVVVLALAASRIVLSLVGVIKGRLATVIGCGLTSTLREQMVRKLQGLAVAYYDRHQVGALLSRVAHDSEVLHGMLHQITGGFLLQAAQLVGVGVMLVWLNPKLALYTLIPVPLVFLGTWFFWRQVYPRYFRLWDASSKQMSVLSGMLSGIRVVKSFAQEEREFGKFQGASDQLRQWRLWVDHTNAGYSAAMQLVFSLGGLIVWYVGGRDVIGADMTLGELIAFLAYLAMFYAPLSALSNFTTWLTSFLSGSKRILELLDAPQTIATADDPATWDEPRGEIRFANVSFGYDRHQPVLKNVSFDVRPGEMVGIVGRSGSGKTTLVNLLGRFYDVNEGQILVDGIDVRELSLPQLRQRIGIVFQDSFLFRGTIWKNLSFGRPETSIEAGLQAARAAGAHDFICRTPLAYETWLGEQGAGLSGGEKQRLSIARTLLYDPRILVLDEATSNIDAESEKSIQEALEVLIRGRTTIAIAHRLSTLRNADRILVFDRGELIEEGSHAQLLTAGGTYARLVKIQTQVSRDPNVDRLLVVAEQSEESTAEITPADREGDSVDPAPPDFGTVRETSSPSAGLHWLEPSSVWFDRSPHGQLELWDERGRRGEGLMLIRTFPASHPEEYLSVRGWQESGEELELGFVRDLKEWPADQQRLMRQALSRRYYLPEIQRVYEVSLRLGYVDFEVETDRGRMKFCMRWTQSQAVDFGEHGKLVIDTEDNRFLIRDVRSLPNADAERFLRYVYW